MSDAAASQPQVAAPSGPPGKLTDLEIKDAQLIFASAWQDLEEDFGRENLRFPKEIILLGGAPGSGKGTNTAFIAKTRGLTCPPIVISALLDSVMANCLFQRNVEAVTADLRVRFILPVPCDASLKLRAWIVEESRLLYKLKSELTLADTVMAWAEATFVQGGVIDDGQ